ncbi:MAG: hypothetical protein K2O00_09125 [Muribaculaceae bacterium]|nr:hypothetical protein [Muribaculaceae bacterium]
MKKIYTFATIALLALSASAQGRQTEVTKIQKPFKAVESITPLTTHATVSTQAVDFSSISDMAGDYDWSYYGLLNNDRGNKTAIVEIKVTNPLRGTISISGIVPAGSGMTTPITATVNLAAGTVTLPNKQDLGQDAAGDHNYFYIKSVTDDGDIVEGAYAGESITGIIDGTTIIFPDEYVFAVGDFENEGLGWWKLTAFNEFTPYVEPSGDIDLSEWTEIATATMFDGWVIPGLKYNDGTYAEAEDFPLQVKIARNNEDEKLILVENPYVQSISGFPMGGGQTGYIVIDVTEPDFVVVTPGVYSGFTNGANKVVCINVEGFWAAQGYTSAVIKQALADDVPEWSTITEDGEGNTVINIPTCRFNYLTAQDKMYTWTDRAEAMKATITFKDPTSGVNNVLAEESDSLTPAEYFNLQGQRIENPAKGQFIIKRQGNTVIKMIAK